MSRLICLALFAFADVALARDIVSPYGTGKDMLARNWGSASRIVLYEHANFSGRAVVISCAALCNFGHPDMKFRASSLLVENGTWKICSQVDLKGECRTVEAGDHPDVSATFPSELERQIKSVKRVSD
jgi:hypothetical protein